MVLEVLCFEKNAP